MAATPPKAEAVSDEHTSAITAKTKGQWLLWEQLADGAKLVENKIEWLMPSQGIEHPSWSTDGDAKFILETRG